MESGPALILRTLDRHLTAPGEVRLFGGAAFVLGYGRDRTTDDADLLLDDRECQVLIDSAGFAEAIDATNKELEPLGLYVSHVFGPEQQVLSPHWRSNCRPVVLPGLQKLSVSCLGPVDLALTKMGRADDADLADIEFLLSSRQLDARALRHAIQVAVVPPEYAELFAAARPKVEALLTAA
ncbi:MAG: DUF6036 family nucleotidyltransferase [Myxococcota bacterium]